MWLTFLTQSSDGCLEPLIVHVSQDHLSHPVEIRKELLTFHDDPERILEHVESRDEDKDAEEKCTNRIHQNPTLHHT